MDVKETYLKNFDAALECLRNIVEGYEQGYIDLLYAESLVIEAAVNVLTETVAYYLH